MNIVKDFFINQYYSKYFVVANSIRKQLVWAIKTPFCVDDKLKRDLYCILLCNSKTLVYSRISNYIKLGKYNIHQLMYIVNRALKINDWDKFWEICLYQLQIALIVKDYNSYWLLKLGFVINRVLNLLNEEVKAYNLLELILDSVIEFFENQDIPLNDKIFMWYMFYNFQKDKGNVLDNTTNNIFNYIGIMTRMFKIIDLIRELWNQAGFDYDFSSSTLDQETNVDDQIPNSTDKTIKVSWMEDMMERFYNSALKKDYKYSCQIWTIKECIEDSYWDNFYYVKISNRFLEIIESLIDSKHTWVNFENERNNITSYFIEYWAELYDKMEEIISLENPKLNKEEIQLEAVKRVNIMEEKFVCLLLESVKYIPNKE